MLDAPRGGEAHKRSHSEQGDALLVARTRLGLTQPAFAARLSEVLGRRIDRTQVAKWEAGVYRPRAAVMLAAATVVGLPLHQLMAEGASMRGPRASVRRAEEGESITNPRQQVIALLELGFSLEEAIGLVRRHSPSP